MAPETATVHIEVDGENEEFEVPVALTEALSEGEESRAEVVTNLAVLSMTQQAHGIVHHSHGDASPELEAAETAIMETFEQRFGQSFAEMTGHDH